MSIRKYRFWNTSLCSAYTQHVCYQCINWLATDGVVHNFEALQSSDTKQGCLANLKGDLGCLPEKNQWINQGYCCCDVTQAAMYTQPRDKQQHAGDSQLVLCLDHDSYLEQAHKTQEFM